MWRELLVLCEGMPYCGQWVVLWETVPYCGQWVVLCDAVPFCGLWVVLSAFTVLWTVGGSV